jgi:hypothetical protein
MSEYRSEYKGYYIQPHKEHPTCYVVVTVGKGGKSPDCLSGMFTSRSIAKFEIETYVANRPIKENDNGETVPKSRSK